MFDFLSGLFGKKTDFLKLKKEGAQIVDVRTSQEFAAGHIFQSVNIPLQDLSAEMKKLDLKKPVITCCASGVRSASARNLLEQNGFNAYNGGGWKNLQKKLES